MRIENHIAFRFLTDDTLAEECLEMMHGKDWINKPVEELANLYALLYKGDLLGIPHTIYYVTDTVVQKLDLLKVNRKQGLYDWKVFSDVPECRKTFILNDGSVLRIWVGQETLYFAHLRFTRERVTKKQIYGQSLWVIFFVNRKTGEQCDHFKHPDVQVAETFIYKLLCFIFLSENTEEIVPPGRKTGTQKSGKFINALPFDVTIVTSKWKITVIRTEGFSVSPHFRLQPYGPGLKKTKIILIEQYEKDGYKRSY